MAATKGHAAPSQASQQITYTTLSMTTTIGTVDQVLLTTSTNPVIAGQNNAALVVATVLNRASATNHTVAVWRVPAGGTPATNNAIVLASTCKPGITVLTFLSGHGLTGLSQLFITASVTNLMNVSATWAISS